MKTSSKNILSIACAFGALAVMVGAFGAHGLEAMLKETGRTNTFETAVKYHMYHALALLVIGLIMNIINHKWLKRGAYFMVSGIVVFSGSLYLLCLLNTPFLGAITPIGGLLLIAGWVLVIIGIKKGLPYEKTAQ